MKYYKFLALLLFVLINTACSEQQSVMVGGDEDYDACGSSAEVSSFVTQKVKVYSTPDNTSDVVDEISAGIKVSACDFSDENFIWVGIVYSSDPSQRCGVGTPIKERQAYSGPCKSGWVEKVNLTNWAG